MRRFIDFLYALEDFSSRCFGLLLVALIGVPFLALFHQRFWRRAQQHLCVAFRRQAISSSALMVHSTILLAILAGPTLAACSSSPPSTPAGSSPLTIQQNPRAQLTYVAIGASDTFGTGTDDPQSQSWPADLANSLGKDVRLINLGIPGIDARQALDVELPVAIDAHPDLVTIWLAVNDLVDNIPIDSYAHNLELIVARMQAAAPQTRIVVANVPDLTLLPRFRSGDTDALHAKINLYNNAITSIVARHHVLLVDLYSRWRELADHPEYISNDGFHPNAIGYTRLAEIFQQVLQAYGQ